MDESIKINEGVSSITLTKNTKGINHEIKVYSNCTEKELEVLKTKAVKLFKDLEIEFKNESV